MTIIRNNLGRFSRGTKTPKPFIKGQVAWNKGLPSPNKGKKYGPPSEITRNKISKSRKGIPAWNKGVKCPWTSDRNKQMNKINFSGEKSHFWKGGITPANKIIRDSSDYGAWRKACFGRDDFTCQKTGIQGGDIEVHHINNFADYPELRFAIDNGITLHISAHKMFHKMYGNRNNTRQQIEEFLNNDLI